MSILVDNYKAHPIHQTIADTLKYIETQKEKDGNSDIAIDSLAAYEQLLVYAKHVLDNNLSQIAPKQLLDNLSSNIKNLQSGHVVNIDGSYNVYTNITDSLAKIPFREQKGLIKESLGKITEGFIHDKEGIKQKVADEIKVFQDEQKQQFDNWSEEKKKLEDEIKTVRSEKETLKTEIASLKSKVTAEETRIATLANGFQTTCDNKMATFQTTFDAKQTEHAAALKAIEGTSKTQTTNILTYLNEKQKEVEKLWGIIGKAGTSGNSQSYANRAKNYAHGMTVLALLIMLCVIIFLGITVYKDISSKEFNPLSLLYRIPLAFTLFLPAWYCANIANKQRNREFQLRDFEVKTASLEPFLESMKMACDNSKENGKDKTKLELVKEIFSKDLNNKKVEDGNIIISKDMVEVIKSCLDSVAKIKGKQ